jgi:membrane protein YqaA with SNARE-associated domain
MLLLIGVAVLAGVLGSVTDWLFMGVLFHDAYNRHPEVWRPAIAAGRDKTAVLLSVAIGFVMSFAIVGLCALADVAGVVQGTLVALLAWIAGPLAVMVINGLFIKLDPRIIVAHSIGYLLRFVLAGAAAGLALSLQPRIG